MNAPPRGLRLFPHHLTSIACSESAITLTVGHSGRGAHDRKSQKRPRKRDDAAPRRAGWSFPTTQDADHSLHLMNNDVVPTFEAYAAKIDAVHCDNGRQFWRSSGLASLRAVPVA